MADDKLIKHYKYLKPDTSSRRDEWSREHLLGKGGCGTVWLESRIQHGRNQIRAVKVVVKKSQKMPDRERQALISLARPGYDDYFCRFLGWDENQFTWLFYMEFFQYGDMRGHLTENMGLPEPQVKDLMWQLTSGLKVMHRDGFTHQGLKPENIFVDQKAPNWRVKIGDFGISKQVQDDDTQLRSFSGTPSYMAPEVHNDRSEYYNSSVDLWSLGVIAFELLLGRRPFVNVRAVKEATVRLQLDHLFDNVSSTGHELVKLLLAFLPGSRPTAVQVFKHGWFQQDISSTRLDQRDVSINEDLGSKEALDTPASASWNTVREAHLPPTTKTDMASIQRDPASATLDRQHTAVTEQPEQVLSQGDGKNSLVPPPVPSTTNHDTRAIALDGLVERTRTPYTFRGGSKDNNAGANLVRSTNETMIPYSETNDSAREIITRGPFERTRTPYATSRPPWDELNARSRTRARPDNEAPDDNKFFSVEEPREVHGKIPRYAHWIDLDRRLSFQKLLRKERSDLKKGPTV